MFPRRHFVSILFDEVNDATGILSDKDCALMLPVSADQLESTGLGFLLPKSEPKSALVLSVFSEKSEGDTKDASHGETENKPSCVKIFIKRSEFADFKNTLQKCGANFYIESGGDDSSNSTAASIKSKMSRKGSNIARTHIELSTKFGHRFPERLMDAQDLIVKEATERAQGTPYSPSSNDASNDFCDNSNGETKTSIDQSGNVSTPAHKPPLSFDQDLTQGEGTFQPVQSLSVAEVTPLQPVNLDSCRARLNYNSRGMLETLSSVWGALDKTRGSIRAKDSFEAFVNDPGIQDVAVAFTSLDDAISAASKAMHTLTASRQRLIGAVDNLIDIPIDKTMIENVSWATDTANMVQQGQNDWDHFNRDLASTMYQKLFTKR